MKNQSLSLSQAFIKGIDYNSEEFVKQLLEQYTGKKCQMISPVNFQKSLESLPYNYGNAGIFSNEADDRLLNEQQGTVFLGNVSITFDFKALNYINATDRILTIADLNFKAPFAGKDFTIRKIGRYCELDYYGDGGDTLARNINRQKELLKQENTTSFYNYNLLFTDVELAVKYMRASFTEDIAGDDQRIWHEPNFGSKIEYYSHYSIQFTGFRALLQ